MDSDSLQGMSFLGSRVSFGEALKWTKANKHSPKLTREKDEARKDLIRFAYWTCLQLERLVDRANDVAISAVKLRTDEE